MHTNNIFRFLLLTLIVCSAASASDNRPNVVVILVDDMGFSDIGCYGSEIPTPNLDKLAANGVRFTQFYNTGRCCPTRAALLTGQYSHAAGVGHMTGDYKHPGYRGFLNENCVTIGDVARSAGYLTAVSGKWHVGHTQKSMWPRSRGFDRFFGIPEGGGFYIKVKKGRSIVLDDDVMYSADNQTPDDFYTTDAFTDYALMFIDDAIAQDKPFLLYLPHNAPHFPLQASAEDIAKFRGTYRRGWDVMSEERRQRMIEMGLVEESWTSASRPEKVKAWNKLTVEEQDKYDHLMAAYAACVYSMDRAIGNLVDGLRSRNKLDNTLILFMSDNGGCAEGGTYGKQPGDPTQADSNWYCGKAWAWMQDTPFRKFKHYNHEGGISTPLIAHWPDRIKAVGSMTSERGHVIDILPTVADVTGAELPDKVNGHDILVPPGQSLVPALLGQALSARDLFWEHEGNAAVRSGDWKLARIGGKGNWELYNLADDRTEANDLAARFPKRVVELKQKWADWAKRNNVAPNGLPKKSKKAD